MRKMKLRYRTWLAVAVVALGFSVPVSLHAQVVVIANGSPITEYDIQQRMKLEAISQRTPNRQQVITDLIDDRLKIARAKVYGLEVGELRNQWRIREYGLAATHHDRAIFPGSGARWHFSKYRKGAHPCRNDMATTSSR